MCDYVLKMWDPKAKNSYEFIPVYTLSLLPFDLQKRLQLYCKMRDYSAILVPEGYKDHVLTILKEATPNIKFFVSRNADSYELF